MTCEDAMMLLSGHLDGVNTQEEESELFAHLQTCSGCRDLLAAFEAADAGIAALEAEPPAGLTDRILDAVRQEPRRRKSARPWLVPVATAAAVAVVCWAGLQALPQMSTSTAVDNAVPAQMTRTETTVTADCATAETEETETESFTATATAPENTIDTADPEAASVTSQADLEAYAAELSAAETAAVLVLDAGDPALEAYDQEILEQGLTRVKLPQEVWESLRAAHPDATVYQPDGIAAVYYAVCP